MRFDVDALIEQALEGCLLTEIEIRMLCDRVIPLLAEESNVKPVSLPVTVVGDVHGQFYDLVELFRTGGSVPLTNYLFLGDYVDRGPFSVETITLLIALKLRYPARVSLLRGNHESRQITQVYGFHAECVRKFGSVAVWQAITDMFDYLPIAALIGDAFLAVHGGLSPSIHYLDQIRLLDRFGEIPHEGPLADLMWSDPDLDKEGFVTSPRGAGYVFGQDVVERFVHLNGLVHIVRAHQLCMQGYQLLFNDMLSTVWSAPNYCYRFGNHASILELGENIMHFNVFGASPDSEARRLKTDDKAPVDETRDGKESSSAVARYFT
jgi:serine/threonine-protein phosphatase PPG1